MLRGLFATKLKFTELILIVLLGTILTDTLTYGQVNVEPNTALLNQGDPTELLCRYGRSINYCRFEIPGEKVLNLSPEWIKSDNFRYYGGGLASGQCGVSIKSVKAINNGQVKCSLGVEGEELTGTIDLVVALRPKQPIITVLEKPDRGYFTEGSLFVARCVVRDGRPAANISWFFDNYPAQGRVGQLNVVASNDSQNVALFNTEQDIQWHLGPEDNGRMLTCRSHHQTDRESLQPQESSVQIFVRFAPVKQQEALVYGLYLEHTAIVNMTIHANPAPVVQWTVDGHVIKQGEQWDRFSVYEPQPLGQDYYNVTMAIAGLTLEDTTKIYEMSATNALGSADYQIRISSSSKPPTAGLDIGAIVGIVVAVAVLIIFILLIVFARATGRWCFGGKSFKTSTTETEKGTQSHGQNVALLETPNGVTILGNKPVAKGQQNRLSNDEERLSVQRRHGDDEDDSFEYATDRESSVYNPTTMPIRNVMAAAGGRNSQNTNNNGSAEPSNNTDLLSRGNQLGIPESRFSRWIPKDQREILEKQAKLLANRIVPKTPEPEQVIRTTTPQPTETEI